MRFDDLTEAAADPLPKKFWLVFDIPTGIYADVPDPENPSHKRKLAQVSDIARGELTGVKGISESRQIMTGWFMVARNAAVVMDPEAVAAANDIEKVHYDDPDWLCASNFRALYRMWDKKPGDKYGDGMMMNLVEYVIGALKELNQQAAHIMQYYGFTTKIAKEWSADYVNRQINSAADAGHLIYEYCLKVRRDAQAYGDAQDFDEVDWPHVVRQALKRVAQIYSDEAEWLVTTPTFRIPKGSPLLIAINVEAAKLWDEWKADKANPKWIMVRYSMEAYDDLMRIIKECRLADHYNVKLVDGRKFDQMRPEVMARRNK